MNGDFANTAVQDTQYNLVLLGQFLSDFLCKAETLADYLVDRWAIASKGIIMQANESMQFWAFEVETGIFHATLFPWTYDQLYYLLANARPLLIVGRIEKEHGAVSVNITCMLILKNVP
ncbi:MAG: hypothetical protein ACREOO_12385 [bacterium]